MSKYIPIFRRKRMGLTDYNARKKAIISNKILAVLRRSNRYISVQFVEPRPEGDKVIASFNSKLLKKLGWKGSFKSVPASYLLGLYAGKKALLLGIRSSIPYLGLLRYVKGGRFSAVVRGLKDAGMGIPSDDSTFPDDKGIAGSRIANFASLLKQQDREKYAKLYSKYMREGFKPELYEEHFKEILAKIGGI